LQRHYYTGRYCIAYQRAVGRKVVVLWSTLCFVLSCCRLWQTALRFLAGVGFHTAKNIIHLLYIFFKLKASTGPRLQGRWVCSTSSALFAPAQKTETDGALLVFRVQNWAGTNTVGKHTLRGSFSHPNGGRQHFYSVFCRDTNHQMEDSEISFRFFFFSFSAMLAVCFDLDHLFEK